MKVVIKRLEPEFKPFDLTLTIEHKRELELLLCLFNASGKELANFANDHIPMSLASKIGDIDNAKAHLPSEIYNRLKAAYLDGEPDGVGRKYPPGEAL